MVTSCENPEIEIKANAQTTNLPSIQVNAAPEDNDNLKEEAVKLTFFLKIKSVKISLMPFRTLFKNLIKSTDTRMKKVDVYYFQSIQSIFLFSLIVPKYLPLKNLKKLLR